MRRIAPLYAVCFGAMILWLGAASAQTLSTQGIDVGAIEAWRDAGATIGWMAPNADGAWLFSERQESEDGS